MSLLLSLCVGEGRAAALLTNMRTAAASAALCLLALVGPGLSHPAEHSSDPGFTLCGDCFYRQTPPRRASEGEVLHPRCHRLPGGWAFATLHRPTCDSAVYSAFHLSPGWTELEGEEETLTEDEVRIPALLRGGKAPPTPASPVDSPLQSWDSAVTTLVQSSIAPQCGSSGADIYILTGAGRLGAAGDGDEKCQMEPLWSAVCCALPEGKGDISVGLIKETGKAGRQVSMKELEEVLGVAELFSEGCNSKEGETAGIKVGFHHESLAMNVENTEAETSEVKEEPQESSEVLRVNAGQMAGEEVSSEHHDSETAAQTSASSSSVQQQDGGVQQNATSEEESTNILVFVLSTAVSIPLALLRPVGSIFTELPGKVTHVVQEDLGVLAALPGDTFSLFHLLTSDTFSLIGSATDVMLGVGESCYCGAFHVASSMLEALLSSCLTGVSGVGTLAGDTVGIFSEALNGVWSVSKFFGGRLWEQTEGYVGTVASEMSGQVQAVGGGFGKLAWRGSNGVGNVFRLSGALIMGVVDMVTGGVREFFGQESQ